jgi:transposase
MRNSFQGLTAIAKHEMKKNPADGSVFVAMELDPRPPRGHCQRTGLSLADPYSVNKRDNVRTDTRNIATSHQNRD